MSHTLQEVAQITGRHYAVIKKHAQRGKLKTTKDGRFTVVTEEDLAVYQAAEGLDKMSDALRIVGDDTKALGKASNEAGNAIARLPPKVLSAILEGMPKSGKGGHAGKAEPFLAAIGDIPRSVAPAEPTEDDPHGGKPIGFRWGSAPRWRRSSKSTWTLQGATWTWNGLMWEGGGAVDGRTLRDDVSPANPYSEKRPLEPKVDRG